MAENAGGIYYDIEMDVQGLLVAQQRVNQRLDLMERGFDGTTRAVNNTERSMSSLSGVAVALSAALSVKQVSEYADAWATVNNKLANSLRANEQLADVTERVFNITQQTRSSLDATASLYARLERATRQYGTSADDLAKLTTIINQGFVVSGATAQEAENAIIQLSQGLASGALRGEEFNSVNEQGNRLIVALADSMGVSIGEMRNMAAQGKLTTDVVVNGLLSQGAVIGKEFANTTTTISQALQVAGNNVTKFFGENSTVKTGAAIFNDTVVTASENIGVLSAALTAAAAIMGSRYVGALTMSAASQIQSALAAQRQATANAQAAQSALIAATSVKRKAVADKEAALSSLALAQAEYNVAKGSAAEMLALDALIAAKSRASAASLSLAQAETAQAAASARAATAASAASVGIGLARGALSLIGGPGGAAMLAASAIFYFWQKAQQAREEALRFADSLDKVNASMKAMNNTQLRGTIADANESIRAQKDEIADLQAEVDSLSSRYRNFTPEAQAVAESLGQGADFARQQAEVSDQLAKKSRDLANAQDKLARTQDTAAEANRTLTNNMLTSMGVHDGLIQKGWSLEQVQSAVAKAFGNTADEINRANQAGQNFNPKALQVSPPTADGDKVILNLEEQNELLKIQDERQRAVTKARMQAAKVTDNPNQISKAGDLAGENFDLQKSEEARKEAQRKSEQQDKRSATAAESVAQKLANLRQQSELAASSAQELSREQAILRAQQSLGSAATQAQIQEAGQYAAKAWDAAAAARGVTEALKAIPEQAENKSYADSMQNLKAALNAGKIDLQEYNAATEQMEQQHQANLAKIRSQQVVNPTQQALAEVDPVQQLANQHAQELALIRQFEQQGVIAHTQALALKKAADTQYEQQRTAAMWEIYRNQSLGNEAIAASFDALAGNASNALTGIITGSMSAQEAAQSLASTVLNSLVNAFVQMGVEWARNAIMGATTQQTAIAATTAAQVAGITTQTAASTAAAATTTAAWTPAAIMSSIASWGGAVAIGLGAMAGVMALAGKRKNGGPVSAGSMYQVGEGGKPEIYQASTGKQYMIPGDNGKVISNKDMQSGGGISVQVNVINQSTGATVQSADGYMQDGSAVVDLLITDMERGGPVSSLMQQTFGLSRKAQATY
ncbi:TPA: tape measure protein [Klebsiella pneumoniae]|uniref:Phage tape measure protein n=1 Tax=Klebsiella pneumoniae TaxID=573 RepID=A0A486NW10_KLEPN|nr:MULTISPECIES: tape measure protein [Klebsiella]WHJ04872.1 tape measure protein [Klebsiella pneumoniae subsp. pneumoniae]EGF65158.1 putative herpesvirus UL46 protein [Klebsiella sp. MS 92-3]EKT9259931.1 tape measure protein [Klebsiella pneumoniae]EKU9285327.1 tape measure protein [Klebsiella pneumoniae]EKW8317396.1 tape measure protein [Klebsiella pneumoniae]